MQRREFLRGVAGTAGIGAVGTGAVAGSTTAGAHPGPYSPFASVAIEEAKEAVVGPDGEYAYVAATDGFAVVDVRVYQDPQVAYEERDLLADRENGPLRLIQDVKVEDDRLLVAGPADPIRADVLQGVLVYDVSDPENPERVAFHETDYPIHNCYLHEGVAYLTANYPDRNALAVVDVSGDSPEEIARWSLTDRDEQWGEIPTGLWTVHDVWVRDGRAYLSHWDAGLVILDVSDPTSPSFVSRFAGRSLDDLESVERKRSRAHVIRLPGNVHYAMTDDSGDLLALNREAWAVDGEGGPGGVELWNISDATSPERLATIDAPPSPNPAQNGTWTTSHNLDLVDGRLFTSWYQGGVKIHDVSDPANPDEMAWWRMPGETAFWTAKRASQRFFVASSIGDYLGGVEGEAGLYTFPIERDQQKSPPSLTTTDGDEGETGSADGGTTTPTTTEQAALEEDTATTAGDAGSSGSAPGFGVGAGIAGLLGAGAWTAYRD
ncbi:LVIVD repeat-containing protein [Halorussus litoreus]|uniref:LVIVD repeat-containing protein n=1 Tax=Halorussus litoreus TaxID=1710536 RepID=UPI000E2385F3|nr:hypothetical protein [Halorussus litoreus]